MELFFLRSRSTGAETDLFSSWSALFVFPNLAAAKFSLIKTTEDMLYRDLTEGIQSFNTFNLATSYASAMDIEVQELVKVGHRINMYKGRLSMTRKKRTKILIEGSAEVSQKLAQEISNNYDVTIIEEINNSLVMVKVRESAKQSLFYLGEVLITECKVMVKGSLGIGMVKGHEPTLAYNLAIIDAAYNAKLSETKEWTNILQLEEIRINKEYEALREKLLMTKVNFNAMNV
ncbi:phosphonate C-P lyase system protein PhnG [Desulfosporosinus sp. SB140]|uniref:phosphonate C-P lyase system protein PhnG n=1 Tax=Desulfosporosinus paludis TaxID=3115649 RepID=UPI00388D2232